MLRREVVIVGGGPGGTTSALYLLRHGIKPIIVEKEAFPRYHIGESMVGSSTALLADLGLYSEMMARSYPVKHGVSVFGRNKWFVPVMSRDADWNLVDEIAWQVRRSDFDKMLLDEAVSRGAELLPGRAVKPLLDDNGGVRGVQVRLADGGLEEIESEVLLDCSGMNTFLASAGVTGPKYLGHYDRQVAFFSQIVGGIRDEGGSRDKEPDNTLIYYKEKYHWGWWIPLDDEVVSVGVVTPSAYFKERKESKKAFLTRELLELHPELTQRLPEFRLVEETRAIPNYSYQVERFTGKGFICVGDAHRFLDPIFSFGLFVSMKEGQMAADAVAAYLSDGHSIDGNPFAEHEIQCEKGIDILEDVLDAFWEHPFSFAVFAHQRYTGEITDMLAGRVYERQPSRALIAFRKLLKRERIYTEPDYSVPIGSRFRPERAPLWEESALIYQKEYPDHFGQ